MKSHFSRFLHHTLSHSDVREVFTSSLSLSDLIGESRSNQVADLSNLDYRVKPDNDNICTGRSMVEMLGVLAIIGVLSVGAIAGYGKAMLKYKLNQHAQAVNMLINNSLMLKDKVISGTNMPNILEKTNSLPDGIYRSGSLYLYDRYFNVPMYIYWNTTPYDGTYGGIQFKFSSSTEGREICRNIVIAAKENAANLWLVEVGKKDSLDETGEYYVGHLYGDAFCTKRNCLRDLDLDKIDKLCSPCVVGTCNIYTLWKR